MIDRHWLTMIVGTLTVTFVTAPSARAGESGVPMLSGVVVCTSSNSDPSYDAEKRSYVSEIFTVNVEQLDAVNNAYRRFLQTRYHVKDNTWCRNAGQGQMSESQARTYEKHEWAKNRVGGFKVIETGWTYTAAENHFAYICTANAARWTGTRAQNVYVRATNPIEIPTSSELEIYQAWAAQLKQSHPELQNVQAGCIRMVAEDAAARQKRLQAMDQNWGSWEIVHVPFSFASSGQPAAEPVQGEPVEAVNQPPAKPKPIAPTTVTTPPPAPKPSVASAPAKPAAPPGVFVTCNSNSFQDRARYYNPPVSVTSGDYAAWMASYQKFLQMNYKYGTGVSCSKLPTLAEAQSYFKEITDTARLTTKDNLDRPWPVVVTNWKYP